MKRTFYVLIFDLSIMHALKKYCVFILDLAKNMHENNIIFLYFVVKVKCMQEKNILY